METTSGNDDVESEVANSLAKRFLMTNFKTNANAFICKSGFVVVVNFFSLFQLKNVSSTYCRVCVIIFRVQPKMFFPFPFSFVWFFFLEAFQLTTGTNVTKKI